MITFRQGNYIVFPVSVPYTAAYKAELTMKSTKALSDNKFSMAISDVSIEDAAAMTSYTATTASTSLTTAWSEITLSDSIVLEEGKTYYVKLIASAVGGGHISQLSNLSLKDNGEFGSNADLSGLSVGGASLSPAFDKDVTDYTVYTTMPADGTIDITATAQMEGSTITVSETSALTTLSASVEVPYGISETPVEISVKSVNGKGTKTYKLHIVVLNTHASLGNTTAYMLKGTSTTKDVTKLFDGAGVVKTNGSGNADFGTSTNVAAYTQIDLGKKYDLYSYTWERTNQGSSIKGIQILGSNDPSFEEGTYELLGTTDGTSVNGPKASSSLVHKLMTTPLSGSQAYRYVRIVKPAGSGSYYPVKMDLYGVPVLSGEETNKEVTVTVPSSEYVVGDTIIVAVYSGKELVDVETVTAPSAYDVTIPVTKKEDTDTVKVMVWKNLRNAIPRDVSQILK